MSIAALGFDFFPFPWHIPVYVHVHTHFHLLVWIVRGLFDDLAVELIPEELLLFCKLRDQVTQSVEEQYTF